MALTPPDRLAAASRRLAPRIATRPPGAAGRPTGRGSPSSRRLYDFEFDDFQLAACRALDSGHGVLVAAPTGSGKTVAGEFAVHLALAQGRKCFYTTPIKALSNQKYGDLVRRYSAATVGPAHRRQQHQQRGPDRGHDHRGAAQHAVRGLADAGRPRPRGAGRGALPGRPVPRRGLGGGDHPPGPVGAAHGAVGHGQQRRGVRRLADPGPRRHHRDRGRAPPGAAVAAHAGRPPALRPVRDHQRPGLRWPGPPGRQPRAAPGRAARALRPRAARRGRPQRGGHRPVRFRPPSRPSVISAAGHRRAAARDHLHLQPGRL